MAQRRSIGLFTTGVLVAVALPAGVLFLRLLDTPALGERLVADASALAADQAARASHVASPAPGSFGDALSPHLAALDAGAARKGEGKDEEKARADADKERRAVQDGKKAIADLPGYWRQALERDGGAALGLLAATHAQTALGPPGLRAIVGQESSQQRPSWRGVLYGGKLGALSIRERLGRGQAQEALGLCVDGQALSRDLAYNGLLAAMVGVVNSGFFLLPCSAALDAAPAAAKRAAARQLLAIRAALPSFAAVYRTESVVMGLSIFGGLLSPAQQARLPASARASITARPDGGGALGWFAQKRDEIILRHAFRIFVEQQARTNQALTLPPPQREAALKELETQAAASINPLIAIASPSVNRYAEGYAPLRDRIDLLLTHTGADLYRAEKGAWPSSQAEALAVLPETKNESKGAVKDAATFTLTREGDALRIAGLRPSPQQRDEAPPVLTVTPDTPDP